MLSCSINCYTLLASPSQRAITKKWSPEPADSWSGILDATKDGPICKQYKAFLKPPILGQEQGCLVLNVFTPKIPEDNLTIPMPVMIFIHGGGFMIGEGSSSTFGPELYMNKDIVLVVMNYRLGPIGFLSTGDEELPGNYGLLDQVLALSWVKDNIHSFGGDPNRVTISGQSTGGASVVFHLISPLSKGLFHRAIAQSGSALCPLAIQENPLNTTKTIAQKVDCPIENITVMIKCLREVNSDLLVTAANFVGMYGRPILSTVPVIENSVNGQFLTESPLKLLEEGKINKVPVISGITANESGSALFEPQHTSPDPSNFTDEDYEQLIKTIVGFGVISGKLSDPKLLQSIRHHYFENVNFENNSNDFILRTIQLSDDANLKSCTYKTEKLLTAAGVPVYTYIWDYANNVSNHFFGGKPVASHGTDLYFLFNMTNAGWLNYSINNIQDFSDQVLELWSNFAAHGNPTPSSEPVAWVPTAVTCKKYLNITTNMEMEDDNNTDASKFWDDILYT